MGMRGKGRVLLGLVSCEALGLSSLGRSDWGS